MSGSSYYIHSSGRWLNGDGYVLEVTPGGTVFFQHRTGERVASLSYRAADAERYARTGAWKKLDALPWPIEPHPFTEEAPVSGGVKSPAELTFDAISSRDAEIVRLREALEVSAQWHDSEADDLGKYPQVGECFWRRARHQSERDRIRAALSPDPVEGEEK